MRTLRDTHYRLISHSTPTHRRHLFESFSTSRRLAGLIGPRGTGKTTLMLQWIREKENPDLCMYASLDHIYFSVHSLLDFVRDMHQLEGRNLFFLDEAHKYPGWNRELKNIYDSFPDIRIVFSGSSSLDLLKGQYDLSRRGMIYRLNGLSFREFILFKTGAAPKAFSFDDLIKGTMEISRELSAFPRIRGLFQEFLSTGYYPFYFEDPETYRARILNTIEKTIFEDIANFYSMNTNMLHVFKRLLAYLASVPPGEMSVNTLARNLEIDHKTVSSYLQMMQETSLIHSLALEKEGKAGLRTSEKVLLENPNLYFAIAKETGLEPSIGILRETFFINALRGVGIPVHYSKGGDYRAKGKIFEIGGPSKTARQLSGAKNGILVKDGPLMAAPGEIPLYLFGFFRVNS